MGDQKEFRLLVREGFLSSPKEKWERKIKTGIVRSIAMAYNLDFT